MNTDNLTINRQNIGGCMFVFIEWPGETHIQTILRLDDFYKEHRRLPSDDEVKALFVKDIKALKGL